jgi:beta-galactosidase
MVARVVVETTGAAVALRLTPDRPVLAGDGRDAAPVTVEALDSRGRPVPTANLPVSFEVSGGRIIGLGNGDANSHEPEKGNARRLYNGLAQVIVQTQEGAAGVLVLRAQAEGLRPAEARIAVRADRGPPSVPRPA